MARLVVLCSAVAILLTPNVVSADRLGDVEAKIQPVLDLFDAIADRQLDVRVIPKDATQANLMFHNRTNQPLRLRIPAAFAGVPVLAQFGGGGGGGFGGGGGGGLGGGGGGQQSFGGGGGGGGGGFGGGGGGFFQVAPEAIRKVQIATVCLEHGKKDPNPRVAYELKPITEFTQDKRVHEVCRLLGSGTLDQQTAQAVAWHLTDGLTWDQLAQKVKIRHLNGSTELFFNRNHVAAAAQIVASMEGLEPEQHNTTSPGEQPEQPHDAISYSK